MNGSEPFNPYPGLRSFEPDEDHLFFGREKQIDDLLKRLRKSRFLSVVGSSGSGKSSVIRSGLIPALYSGMMTRAGSGWRVAILRPGDDPIGHLAKALNDWDVLGPEDEDSAEMNRSLLETTLRSSAVGLADAVRQSGMPRHENLLVVVDQFEELFRFKQSTQKQDSRREALTFVKLLLEGTKVDDVAVYVVITMRSDFIGNCMDFPNLPEAVNEGQYLIPRMTRDELRVAITGPAAVAGGEISPRLVRTLLNEVGDNPDQLPILQHALMRTWDYWENHHDDGQAVDLEDYRAIGTMREALSRHAEEAYGELASNRERDIAERLFKALTDKGPHARGIRRPCRLEEVCGQVGAEADEVVAVAERFRRAGRSFLMPPSDVDLEAGSVLDISHESLMRVWTRLIDWLDEEGQSAQLYRRLSRAAARHEAGEGGLWRAEELALALPWRERNHPTAEWAQRYDAHFDRAIGFLEESEKARNAFLQKQKLERRRKLQRARWLNWAAAIGGVLVLLFAAKMWRLSEGASIQSELALTAKAYAEQQQKVAEKAREDADRLRQVALLERSEAEEQRSEAEEQRELAEEQQAIAQAQRRRAIEKERQAMAHAGEAQKAREQAEEARSEAEASRLLALRQKEEAETARAKAEQAEVEAQRLRRLAQFREIVFQTLQADRQATEVPALVAVQAFHLYRQLEGGGQEDPHVFDVLRHNSQRLGSKRWDVLAAHKGPARAVALTADGTRLASGGEGNRVRVLDLVSGIESESLKVGRSGVASLVFSSRETLVVGGVDGSLQTFDLGQPKPVGRRLAGHGGAVTALAMHPGGSLLVSGATDGTLRSWSLSTREPAGVDIVGSGSAITALAFGDGSGSLAVGRAGGGVSLVAGVGSSSMAGGGVQLLAPGDVRSVAFSADGRSLAAGFADGEIKAWDLETESEPRVLRGHRLAVNRVRFADGGQRLISASDDGSARVWPLSQPTAEALVLSHGAAVNDVVFNPVEDTVVTASDDRTISLWPTRSDQLAREICQLVSRNLTRQEWSELLPMESAYEATCPGLPSG